MKGNIRYTPRCIWVMPLIFISLIIIVATQGNVLADDIPDFPVPTSMTLTAYPQYIPINGGTATINATVYDQFGDPIPWYCEFRNDETNLGTLSSTLAAGNESHPYQEVTLTSGATQGTEKIEVWPRQFESLKKTVYVEFTAADVSPPSVSNPSASPGVILNDNGRARPAGTAISQLNVTVTDDAGIASVTIGLSPIGGSATQAMTLIEGTNINGIWSVTTTATAGINESHSFLVNATDFYGRTNNTVSVPLAVLRRGDVVRDNVIDMKDMLYIARYTVGFEPEASNPPSVFVGDVVGEAGNPAGDGKADMKDALFIARRVAGLEEEP
jgi:hypothetical protein